MKTDIHRKDAIYRAYQRGEISSPQLLRQLRDEEEPPSEWQWVLAAVSVGCIGVVVAMALWR